MQPYTDKPKMFEAVLLQTNRTHCTCTSKPVVDLSCSANPQFSHTKIADLAQSVLYRLIAKRVKHFAIASLLELTGMDCQIKIYSLSFYFQTS